MKTSLYLINLIAGISLLTGIASSPAKGAGSSMQENKARIINLPEHSRLSSTSVEEALMKRRSVRRFSGIPLSLDEVSQLLWSAQGISDPDGLRTAPSAGALYPLEIYIAAGDVDGLPDGVYKYVPHRHEIVKVEEGDRRKILSSAALQQGSVRNAPAVIVISAVYERVTVKYGDRGVRYVHIEAGHASQNVFLQAVSLNLGTVAIGAFHDEKVKEILAMPEKEEPLYLMPVGKIK